MQYEAILNTLMEVVRAAYGMCSILLSLFSCFCMSGSVVLSFGLTLEVV